MSKQHTTKQHTTKNYMLNVKEQIDILIEASPKDREILDQLKKRLGL